MSEWQPIETAPKDGSWVILLFDHTEPTALSGFWGEGNNWFGSEAASPSLPDLFGEPTHWISFPAPSNTTP